jgi:uncharacterized coiled-coil DUF342 family protein
MEHNPILLAELARLHAVVSQLTADNIWLRSANIKLNQHIDDYRDDTAELRESIAILELEAEEYRGERDELAAGSAGICDKLEELECELEDARIELSDMRMARDGII